MPGLQGHQQRPRWACLRPAPPPLIPIRTRPCSGPPHLQTPSAGDLTLSPAPGRRAQQACSSTPAGQAGTRAPDQHLHSRAAILDLFHRFRSPFLLPSSKYIALMLLFPCLRTFCGCLTVLRTPRPLSSQQGVLTASWPQSTSGAGTHCHRLSFLF